MNLSSCRTHHSYVEFLRGKIAFFHTAGSYSQAEKDYSNHISADNLVLSNRRVQAGRVSVSFIASSIIVARNSALNIEKELIVCPEQNLPRRTA
jgi:hypothetical protein